MDAETLEAVGEGEEGLNCPCGYFFGNTEMFRNFPCGGDVAEIVGADQLRFFEFHGGILLGEGDFFAGACRGYFVCPLTLPSPPFRGRG